MVDKIINVLSLFYFYAKFDFMWLTRDYKYLLTIMLSEFFILVSEITAIFLLAERFGGIGHWSKNEILFMLAYAAIVGGILNAFFNNNFGSISRKISRGQLDHSLMQPRPLWLIFCTEGFVPFSGSLGLLFGCSLMVYALSVLSFAVTIIWLLLLLVNILSSALIVLCISYIVGALAFWQPKSTEEVSGYVNQIFEQLKSFPLDGVSGVLSTFFLFVVPVGLVAWMPSKMFLQSTNYWQYLQIPMVALVYLMLSIFIFKKGLRHYEKYGCQRYVSYGHRG